VKGQRAQTSGKSARHGGRHQGPDGQAPLPEDIPHNPGVAGLADHPSDTQFLTRTTITDAMA